MSHLSQHGIRSVGLVAFEDEMTEPGTGIPKDRCSSAPRPVAGHRKTTRNRTLRCRRQSAIPCCVDRGVPEVSAASSHGDGLRLGRL